MRKITAMLLCVILLLSLSGCSAQGKMQRYAKACWEDVGSPGITPDEVYVMQYTSRSKLSDKVPETDIYEEIPSRGYAILFHSYRAKAGEPFFDSFACFLNEDGRLVFSFDYEENHDLYEANYGGFSINNIQAGERALEYLQNCNYIANMINYAANCEPLELQMEKNIWYEFSEEQIEKIIN